MLWGFTYQDWNGSQPAGSLLIDAAGNLFGVTTFGGDPVYLGGVVGTSIGIVFKLSADHHTLTVLHRFDQQDGANPETSLVADKFGNIYGITPQTIFKMSDVGFVRFPK